jgi:ribonuclease HII
MADSKQLSEHQRESMFERIVGAPDVGFEACILSAEDLSNKMLRAYAPLLFSPFFFSS